MSDQEEKPFHKTETILEEAQCLITTARQQEYGAPADDFARTAGAWKALFGWDVKPEDVPKAMIIVKLSRSVQSPRKRDHVVDIAGYAGTIELVWDEMEKRSDTG
jgi:hypothetical protein